MIEHSYLKKILDYNPWTGLFTWRKKLNKKMIVGKTAGTKDKDGYIIIKINKKHYKAHILAWFYMTKECPTKEIDHKNNVKDDNNFNNLRLSFHDQNAINRPKQKNNKSGYKGVYWDKNSKKWKVEIKKCF